MAKRFFDILFSVMFLFILSPICFIATIGVKMFGGTGPVLYRARRVGRYGQNFFMYKFRTMLVEQEVKSVITLLEDPRIFTFGKWLRKTKIDEIPQLLNILLGEMSVVGPRPEDIYMVEHHYDANARKTLQVRPGLVSPGSLYYYTHGHLYLQDHDVEESYIEHLLPLKLELEVVYIAHQSFWYDLKLIGRTCWIIIQIVCGKRTFQDPPEMKWRVVKACDKIKV